MRTRNELRKLNRLELVELIHSLRKENVELEARCNGLEERIAQLEQEKRPDGQLEEMNARLCDVQDTVDRIWRQMGLYFPPEKPDGMGKQL